MPDEDKPQPDSNRDLDVSMQDIGPARKCLTIEVPAGRIAQKIESNYSRLKTDAAVPGFRKGRVPMRLLERRFGTSVRDDARNQLLSECYSQAVEDNQLDVIGEPDIKDVDEIKLPEDGPLQFKVEVEVSPDFELPELTGIKVTKPNVDVTEADIDQELDRLCKRLGTVSHDEEGTVHEGDFVRADVRILAGQDAGPDAQELLHDPLAWIAVPGKDKSDQGHVAGIAVDQLGKLLGGKKSQDEISVSMTGPAGHEDERIKDQPITIAIRIQSVERLKPASLDGVVQYWGLQSEDQLRQRVGQMLKDRHERQQKSLMHEQICQYLSEKVQLNLPEGLTSRQSARLLQREALDLAYAGLDPQEIDQKLAQLRRESEEKARQQLRQFFILDKAAKSLEIDVAAAEVNGRIAAMAVQQDRRPEKLRQEMQRNGELEYLFLQIREQKTLDKILESAQITEEPATPPKQEQSDAGSKKTAKRSKTTKKKS